MKWEKRRSSISWIMLAVLGFAISAIGISILAEHHPTLYGCRLHENTAQSKECLDAETYEDIGIVITVVGFTILVTCGIIILFAKEAVIFTCPHCHTSNRMTVSSIPTNCPKCGMEVSEFESHQSKK